MPLPIETPRLLLRPFVIEDAEAMHVLYTDPEVMRYLPAELIDDMEVSRQRVQRHINFQRQHGISLWGMIEKVTGRLIGDCGLIPLEGKGPEVEVGYHLRRDCWGKGYASEAAAASLRYGFEELGLERIVAVVLIGNAASNRVLEKCGMTCTGPTRVYGHDVLLWECHAPHGPRS